MGYNKIMELQPVIHRATEVLRHIGHVLTGPHSEGYPSDHRHTYPLEAVEQGGEALHPLLNGHIISYDSRGYPIYDD